MGEALRRYLGEMGDLGRTPKTVYTVGWVLRPFVAALVRAGARHAGDLGRDDALAYAVRLARRAIARRTFANWLRMIRRFTRWLHVEGATLEDVGGAIPQPRVPPREPPRRVPSEQQVAALYRAARGGDPARLRDRAMLEVLYGGGLRRAEAVALEVRDLDLAEGVVTVRAGKGGRDRLVPLPARAVATLARYVSEARPLLLRGRPDRGALLLRDSGEPLRARFLPDVLQDLGERAGVRHVTAHALRHAVATHLLRAGVPLPHVQRFLGHARLETTAIYTHLAKRDLRRAIERAHPRETDPREREEGLRNSGGRATT